MATNSSNDLFHVSCHVKLFIMHEINEMSQQMFVSLDDKEQHVLISSHGVFPNVQLLLERDIGYRPQFLSPD